MLEIVSQLEDWESKGGEGNLIQTPHRVLFWNAQARAVCIRESLTWTLDQQRHPWASTWSKVRKTHVQPATKYIFRHSDSEHEGEVNLRAPAGLAPDLTGCSRYIALTDLGCGSKSNGGLWVAATYILGPPEKRGKGRWKGKHISIRYLRRLSGIDSAIKTRMIGQTQSVARGLDAFRTSLTPVCCLAPCVSGSEEGGALICLTGSPRVCCLSFDQSRNLAEAKVHGLPDGVSAPRVFRRLPILWLPLPCASTWSLTR